MPSPERTPVATAPVDEPAHSRRRDVPVPTRRRLLLACALAGVAFLGLAVLAHREPYFPIDLTISRAVQGIGPGGFALAFDGLNRLGFPPVVGFAYGLVILAIFVRGSRWESVASAIAALGGAVLNNTTKLLVDRPRPAIDLIHVEHQISSSTFPAGHVLNFTAFAGFLCVLAWAAPVPRWRRLPRLPTTCW